MSWAQLLSPAVIVFMIPIAGILVGGAIAIASMVITHRERMAKIMMGMDPDAEPEKRSGDRTSHG